MLSPNKAKYDYLKSLVATSGDVVVSTGGSNAPGGGNRGSETKRAIEKYGLPPQENGKPELVTFNTPFPLFYTSQYVKDLQNCINLSTNKNENIKLSSLKWDYNNKVWINPSTNIKYKSPKNLPPITQFRVNKQEKTSLETAYNQILSAYGIEKIYELGLNTCSGTYVPRTIRNGTSYSMHSWGIAIDILAGPNPNKVTKNAAFLKPEYKRFLDIMEANGWYSGGRAWNRDYMHFQTIKT
jgi:hypothetical protein